MDVKDIFKKIIDQDGKEHIICNEMCINDKKYIVTLERKVFIEYEPDVFIKCTENDDNDEVLKAIFESLKPAKSLDVIDSIDNPFRLRRRKKNRR